MSQMSRGKAQRAQENSAYVRKLLRQRQPEFAAALTSAEQYFSRLAGHPARDVGALPSRAERSDEDMPEHNLPSIDAIAEIEINRIEPTPTLLRGGYQIRITVHDPKPERTVTACGRT